MRADPDGLQRGSQDVAECCSLFFDGQGLRHGVLEQANESVLDTDPGLFVTGHGLVRRYGVNLVNPDGAGLQALGDALSLAVVARPDRGTETKVAVVGTIHGLIDRRELQ